MLDSQGLSGHVWWLMTRHTILTHPAMNLNPPRPVQSDSGCQRAPLSIKDAGGKGWHGLWVPAANLKSSWQGSRRSTPECQDGPSNLIQCDAGDTCVIISLEEQRNAGQYSIVEALIWLSLWWWYCSSDDGVQGSRFDLFCPGALRCGVAGAPLPTEIRLISQELPKVKDVQLTERCRSSVCRSVG